MYFYVLLRALCLVTTQLCICMYVVNRVAPANAYMARRLRTPYTHGDRQHTKACAAGFRYQGYAVRSVVFGALDSVVSGVGEWRHVPIVSVHPYGRTTLNATQPF